MGSYIVIGLVMAFFILSLVMRRIQHWRGMPYLCIALMVFFVVNAVIGNGRFYGNVLFAIVALGLAIRSFRRVGDAKRNAKN